jgi:hypothetical protein
LGILEAQFGGRAGGGEFFVAAECFVGDGQIEGDQAFGVDVGGGFERQADLGVLDFGNPFAGDT